MEKIFNNKSTKIKHFICKQNIEKDFATTVADVEERLLSEIQRYISGEWETKSCKQVQVYDYIAKPEAEKWYKARVELITIDNEKETRKAVNVYAQADNISEATKAIHQGMGNNDFEVASITRTKLVDIIRAIH